MPQRQICVDKMHCAKPCNEIKFIPHDAADSRQSVQISRHFELLETISLKQPYSRDHSVIHQRTKQ
jgi:fibrillarin-like rRNA methylase